MMNEQYEKQSCKYELIPDIITKRLQQDKQFLEYPTCVIWSHGFIQPSKNLN